jgi:hypothetical protein
MAEAAPMTTHFLRSVQAATGSYIRIKKRLTWVFIFGTMVPTTTALAIQHSQEGRKEKFLMWVKSRRKAGSSKNPSRSRRGSGGHHQVQGAEEGEEASKEISKSLLHAFL